MRGEAGRPSGREPGWASYEIGKCPALERLQKDVRHSRRVAEQRHLAYSIAWLDVG